MADKKIVIIPTYNEKENIENIIRKVFSLEGGFDILIIDDGSPDGTANIVKGLQQEFPERLFMIERAGNRDLEPHISQDSNGLFRKDMTTLSKWMRTSPTTRTTCLDSIRPARTAQIWQSAHATVTASA